MKIDKVIQRSELLHDYCLLSRPDDSITVTEWPNDEKYDTTVSSALGNQFIALTHGEPQLLNILTTIKEKGVK